MKFIKFSALVSMLYLLFSFGHIPMKYVDQLSVTFVAVILWSLVILFYYACFLKACELLRFGGKMLGFQLVEKPKPIEKPIVQSFSYKAGRKIGVWLRH